MIKEANSKNLEYLANLAVQLWPENTPEDIRQEFEEMLLQNQALILLKYVGDIPVGFAQCQLRYDYVEGTQSSPVGYLEGIFVLPGFRRKGFALELLQACETWAKEKGCTEFASDCELENARSIQFHKAVHFEEANRIVCFTKKL